MISKPCRAKGDADLAARRLAAWCRSCASGDWSLFGRRLERDGLAIGQVLAEICRRSPQGIRAPPAWIDDAIWIEAALQKPGQTKAAAGCQPSLVRSNIVHAGGRTGRGAALVAIVTRAAATI